LRVVARCFVTHTMQVKMSRMRTANRGHRQAHDCARHQHRHRGARRARVEARGLVASRESKNKDDEDFDCVNTSLSCLVSVVYVCCCWSWWYLSTAGCNHSFCSVDRAKRSRKASCAGAWLLQNEGATGCEGLESAGECEVESVGCCVWRDGKRWLQDTRVVCCSSVLRAATAACAGNAAPWLIRSQGEHLALIRTHECLMRPRQNCASCAHCSGCESQFPTDVFCCPPVGVTATPPVPGASASVTIYTPSNDAGLYLRELQMKTFGVDTSANPPWYRNYYIWGGAGGLVRMTIVVAGCHAAALRAGIFDYSLGLRSVYLQSGKRARAARADARSPPDRAEGRRLAQAAVRARAQRLLANDAGHARQLPASGGELGRCAVPMC
jgi:hypothetical protein